ncbi:DUF2335 domain-containing protein [Fusobacterium animalis]|uniref:DUF2335 domain-containing protein n=1 Tax=Fusobacterium animalis TaxID=76859 RepID=UPI0030CD26D8
MSNNDKKEVIVKQQHIKHYSGIIPHPEIVEGYERNCPGATDRILAMTENQLKSSQEIELSEQNNINECRLTMLKSDIEYNKRGQIFGFILLFTMIIGGFVLVYIGREVGLKLMQGEQGLLFVLVYIGREVGGYGAIIGSITIAIASVIWNKQKNKDKN